MRTRLGWVAAGAFLLAACSGGGHAHDNDMQTCAYVGLIEQESVVKHDVTVSDLRTLIGFAKQSDDGNLVRDGEALEVFLNTGDADRAAQATTVMVAECKKDGFNVGGG